MKHIIVTFNLKNSCTSVITTNFKYHKSQSKEMTKNLNLKLINLFFSSQFAADETILKVWRILNYQSEKWVFFIPFIYIYEILKRRNSVNWCGGHAFIILWFTYVRFFGKIFDFVLLQRLKKKYFLLKKLRQNAKCSGSGLNSSLNFLKKITKIYIKIEMGLLGGLLYLKVL